MKMNSALMGLDLELPLSGATQPPGWSRVYIGPSTGKSNMVASMLAEVMKSGKPVMLMNLEADGDFKRLEEQLAFHENAAYIEEPFVPPAVKAPEEVQKPCDLGYFMIGGERF